jgi:glutamyl-tRNA reductase
MKAQPNHPAPSVAETADATCDAEVEELWQWGEGLAAVSVITQFREELNGVRERELTRAFKRLPDLTVEQRMTLERLSQALMNEFMHEPSVRLRTAATDGRGLGIVEVARYLFALDDGRAITGSVHGGDMRAA